MGCNYVPYDVKIRSCVYICVFEGKERKEKGWGGGGLY